MDGGQRHDRRQILKIFTIGGVATALVLPTSWTRPLVKSVIVPAHAQASPRGGGGGGQGTTTPAPTTTGGGGGGQGTTTPAPTTTGGGGGQTTTTTAPTADARHNADAPAPRGSPGNDARRPGHHAVAERRPRQHHSATAITQ